MVDLNTIHVFHRFWCCVIICYFCLLYFVISDKEQSHLLPLLVTDFLGTFVSSIVTTIHCPCYWRHCTVHIYVVIHFCDSMWSFRVKVNQCRFLLFIYICIAVGDPVMKREVDIPLTGFSRHICVPVPNQNLDCRHHMSWSLLYSVSSVKMRGDCSCCWHWWICLNFLFIIYRSCSFRNGF